MKACLPGRSAVLMCFSSLGVPVAAAPFEEHLCLSQAGR